MTFPLIVWEDGASLEGHQTNRGQLLSISYFVSWTKCITSKTSKSSIRHPGSLFFIMPSWFWDLWILEEAPFVYFLEWVSEALMQQKITNKSTRGWCWVSVRQLCVKSTREPRELNEKNPFIHAFHLRCARHATWKKVTYTAWPINVSKERLFRRTFPAITSFASLKNTRL